MTTLNPSALAMHTAKVAMTRYAIALAVLMVLCAGIVFEYIPFGPHPFVATAVWGIAYYGFGLGLVLSMRKWRLAKAGATASAPATAYPGLPA